jgi:hypothetical protein
MNKMSSVIDVLKSAMSYNERNVKNRANDLLEKLGSELDDVGYEPGTGVEDALTDLQESMDQADDPGDVGDNEDDLEEEEEED